MSLTTLETVANHKHIPAITITTPTPSRSTTTHELPDASTATPTNSATPTKGAPLSYRLLYRGALSLPDSLLLLDGLTFAARLDSPSKQSTFHLLENPLALALESMRGRPTLRHLGIVNLKDVYLDESGGVEMYVFFRICQTLDIRADFVAFVSLGIYTRLPCFHRFILRIPSACYHFLHLWHQLPTLLPHHRSQRSGYELRSVIAVSCVLY